MPSLKVHCAISNERTKGANDYRELHQWMDEPAKKFGRNHRLERHTLNDQDKAFVERTWGKRAVVEWLFHIAIDNIDTAFKISRGVYGESTYNVMKFGLFNNGYIGVDFGSLDEDELASEFDEEYQNEEYD